MSAYCRHTSGGAGCSSAESSWMPGAEGSSSSSSETEPGRSPVWSPRRASAETSGKTAARPAQSAAPSVAEGEARGASLSSRVQPPHASSSQQRGKHQASRRIVRPRTGYIAADRAEAILTPTVRALLVPARCACNAGAYPAHAGSEGLVRELARLTSQGSPLLLAR